MDDKYKIKLDWAKKHKKQLKKQVVQLKKMRKGKVDELIHPLHDNAFEEIDCLKCANCCKTTGPLFTQTDIQRIADHHGITSSFFISRYLRIDEDNDFVLKSVPCTFLGQDNMCSIYDVRPKACREYPHTDRANQLGILALTEKNSKICPAVANIFENLNLGKLG
jgi:Fe-S-cluster containining protein